MQNHSTVNSEAEADQLSKSKKKFLPTSYKHFRIL